ncbi:hypothetical protein [Paracnuella aquatica]|uniref:hypothetical protein n=1 Tax=Paracnuella aquatica TaxID=2268757 RepID=UPI000DEEFE60|nr:hypothetical protein [Paracnuella aquatica]RPD51413.1 hypothetical protein DRJ53_01645 [Paracnuella aquatica]
MRKLKYSTVNIDAVGPDGKRIARTVLFVQSGVTYYHNAQHLLLELERGQRALYDFLCEWMDATNTFVFDEELKAAFIAFVSTVTSAKRAYSKGTAAQHLGLLVDLGLVLRTDKLNFYCVNPKYAYKGSEIQRKALLKKLIERRVSSSLSIDKLVDVPVDQLS